ncbi:glycosyltransferase family 4 protein [Sporomusa sp.]|uniref:glycosyltransferase family 4 protein n=1 Tax=Sporomusa sp. TaxID=2078658 RepID=UPI002BADEB51|nr:glycosyltransferase family 4 protein [Sporomusa sp.]HWR45832.1 glycosyltransferase family 4 protein [Sporomusa sp.]
MIRAFIKQGHEVVALAPEQGFEDEIAGLGATYRTFPLQRTGMNPLKDLGALIRLIQIIKEVKPDIVLTYTIKPVIYGSLAARFAGVKNVYSMITGLGYAFGNDTVRQKLIGLFVKILYRIALDCNNKVFFQNPDDRNCFRKISLIVDEQAVLINGSGVNTERFSLCEAQTHPVRFLLIARMIKEKGIHDYIAAIKLIRQKFPEVEFAILGSIETSPSAISKYEIHAWEEEGLVRYLGETADVRPYIANASVYVLPSFYPEGTPRSILEAMSMGKPIITTNSPGCKETVQDGVNGFLVPVKDSRALAQAMERFIVQPGLITAMGGESRRIALEKYDVHKVNKAILNTMGLIMHEENI